ncbi:hypothetical protein F9C07_10390 [Aspergillus flavus]|uniref:Uncharacterized protein n=1 Tax=Aspergillus flavus (strain ATCC 200026 / FGSC A1120 / IAM 13836 / NRRL 3357 / JCM 12722 / SRRC 167) TaxID=332952 RepID=A0A7U2MVU7_ASPFN|nr:hypothetical protein AFLA70_3g008790 [Aspergillus flavus AF70]QRD90802.1 hypothetical protein F9C07_10390 [Aspergillus flavus]
MEAQSDPRIQFNPKEEKRTTQLDQEVYRDVLYRAERVRGESFAGAAKERELKVGRMAFGTARMWKCCKADLP